MPQFAPLETHPSYRRNLAGAWINLATVHLDPTDVPNYVEAREAALSAIALVRVNERLTVDAAELALKARRALCAALGQLLVVGHPTLSETALCSEASDAVDEALALARAWEQRGVMSFRPLTVRFYRFGAQLYSVHQPQFLAEFLLENLLPARTPGAISDDPELHAIARATIARAFSHATPRERFVLDEPADQRALQLRRQLRDAQSRLDELTALSLSALAVA